MLGIYLLFIIAGRPFYRLAIEHDKNQWLFGFLGILSYYIGSNVFLIILGVLLMLVSSIDFTTYDDKLLGLVGIPFGMLMLVVLQILEEKMGKKCCIEYKHRDT